MHPLIQTNSKCALCTRCTSWPNIWWELQLPQKVRKREWIFDEDSLPRNRLSGIYFCKSTFFV